MTGHRWANKNPNTPAEKARKAEYNTKAYKAQREACRALVATGQASCWRCRRPIPPNAQCGRDWHTGHDDHDRTIIRGPECATCNRSAGARRAAQTTNASRQGKPPPVAVKRPVKPPRPFTPRGDWV